MQVIDTSSDESWLETPSRLLERQPLAWEQSNEVALLIEDNNPRRENLDKQLAEKNKALI